MFDLWIIFAVLSGIFVSLRELYIKKYIKQPPEIISFTTRFYGSIVFIIIAWNNNIKIENYLVFFSVTIVTVLITAFTTVVRLKLIKEEDLSLTTPWLGVIPLFMVIWSIMIYQELPGKNAFFGILLVCLGAFTINLKRRSLHLKKASAYMLLIAALLGLTTTVDRIAIGSASAITYSFIWTILSTFLMYGVAKKRYRRVLIMDKHLVMQAVLWVAEFLFQTLAIQYISVANQGPTYVKTLTMLHIVITTVLGTIIFREKDWKKRVVSAIIIFFGATILILFR